MKNERVAYTLEAVIEKAILSCGWAGSLYNTNQTEATLFDSTVHLEGGRLYKIDTTIPDEDLNGLLEENYTFPNGYAIARPGRFVADAQAGDTGKPYVNGASVGRALCNIKVFLFNPTSNQYRTINHFERIGSWAVSNSAFGKPTIPMPKDLLSGTFGLTPLKDENNNNYYNIPAGWDVRIMMRQIAVGTGPGESDAWTSGAVIAGITSYCEKY